MLKAICNWCSSSPTNCATSSTLWQSTLKAFSKLHRSRTADIKIEVKLTDDDWFPQTADAPEHGFKQDTINKDQKY